MDRLPGDILFYIEDSSFRNWVLHRRPQDAAYWEQWQQQHPSYQKVLLQAKDLLLYITANDASIQADAIIDKNELWKKIQSTVNYFEENGMPPAPAKISFFQKYRWYAAAAVFAAILITALYTLLPNNFFKERAAIAKNVIQPGGSHAYLQLPDKQALLLDTIPDGIIFSNAYGIVIKRNDEIQIKSNQELQAEQSGSVVISTPSGGRYRVLLPDSTQVWMNAASSLTVPLDFNTRRVNMDGECFFDVKHLSAAPFLVHNRFNTVQVFGTAFNVSLYDKDRVQVSLVRGKISILQKGKEKVLHPGQKAVCIAKDNIIDVAQNDDLEPDVAWKDGFFSFKDDDIKTVMQQLSKWYKCEVVYNTAVHEKFNGRIPMGTPIEKVLKILELTGGVKFNIEGNKIFVIKK